MLKLRQFSYKMTFLSYLNSQDNPIFAEMCFYFRNLTFHKNKKKTHHLKEILIVLYTI